MLEDSVPTEMLLMLEIHWFGRNRYRKRNFIECHSPTYHTRSL